MDKRLEAKAVNLYENHYVDFIRTCDQQGGVYFKAQVRAEMKANEGLQASNQFLVDSGMKNISQYQAMCIERKTR
jgi:hypothetical protein